MTGLTRWGVSDTLDAVRRPLPWPQRLLIVGPVGLGDTVLALPALRRIRRAAPHTEVTWLARAAFRPVIAMMNVHHFQADDDLAAFDAGRFGAVLCMADRGAEVVGGMARIAGVPVRIGSAAARSRPRWWNHIVQLTRFGWPRHEAQRYLRLLRPFGQHEPASAAELVPDWRPLAPRAALPDGVPPAGHVVLHPFSMGHGREWPLAHWLELARLLTHNGQTVVLTGSAAERERLASAWPQARRPSGVFDTAGQLDMAQLMALLCGAHAVVASGTGPLHLAAALGTPTLGLFPPRKGVAVGRWAALGRAAVSVQAFQRCPRLRSCDNNNCSCMAALAPAAVAGALAPGPDGAPQLASMAAHAVAVTTAGGLPRRLRVASAETRP